MTASQNSFLMLLKRVEWDWVIVMSHVLAGVLPGPVVMALLFHALWGDAWGGLAIVLYMVGVVLSFILSMVAEEYLRYNGWGAVGPDLKRLSLRLVLRLLDILTKPLG